MTDPMTPERLAEIEARANSATEGPWWLAHPGLIYGKDPHHEGYAQAVAKADPSDAEFVAHARTDVPALLAEVRRLQGAVERARAIIRDDCDQIATHYGDGWPHLPGCQAHEPGDLAGLCPLCRITAALDGDEQ